MIKQGKKSKETSSFYLKKILGEIPTTVGIYSADHQKI